MSNHYYPRIRTHETQSFKTKSPREEKMDSIHVEFSYKISPLSINHVTISSTPLFWTWTTTLTDFEVIHGLSRIIKMIPDKIAIAEEINKQNVEEERYDGTFFINLVIDLLDRYIQIHQERHNDHPENEDFNTTFHIFLVENMRIYDEDLNDENPSHTDLMSSMHILRDCLQTMITTLKTKDYYLYRQQGKAICKILDLINIYTYLFLQFIHPGWIHTRRHGLQEHILDTQNIQVQERINELPKFVEILQEIYSKTSEP